jgi:hypothetical protein
MSNLFNVFVEPAKVFAELKDKPTFLAPTLVLALLTAASAFAYFFTVDPEWFMNNQLAQMSAQMSAAEVEQAKAFLPGARTSAYIAVPSMLIVLAVVYALMGLYYLLAGKVTGNPVSFRQGLAITAWSSLPVALGALVAIVAVFTSSPQSTFESMQLLNVDPLLVQLPMDHPWSRLAKAFSLLNFWAWFLAALCWKTWFRTGWGQAVFVVILPSLVIYGGMAALAAF